MESASRSEAASIDRESTKQPLVEGKTLPKGSKALADQYQASKRPGSPEAQRARVDAARAAAAQLARQLPGHGVDLEAFSQAFGSSKYGSLSKSQVASAASFAFMKAALTGHPELADRAIAMRENGLSGTDRELVKLGVERSGAKGYAKYAECERVIRELAPFDSEQRKDILGLVRAGASLASAIADERKELAQIAKQERAPRARPSLEAQRQAALKNARAAAAQWQQVSRHMNIAIRSVPKLSPAAELAVGVGAGAGTMGALAWGAAKSAITRDSSHLGHAADEAGRAGSYMAGELTSKIARADQLFLQFSKQHVAYAQENARYQRAVQRGDHEAVVAAAARLKTLGGQMAETVKAFDALAKQISGMNKQFDAAAAHAAIHLAVSAVGMGLAVSSEPLKTVAEGIHHGVSHVTAEGAVVDGASTLTH